MRNVRRKKARKNSKVKALIFRTVGVLALIYLTILVISGDNGLIRYFELKSSRDNISAETVAIKRQSADINKQIEVNEEKPHMLEEFAREYGLTKKGELVFKFDNKE